jgi:16S rRNA (guanine527-N7)-methyltransferase
MRQGDWLASHVKAWQIELSPQQREQFSQYYQLLIETNQVMNLTTITSEHEVYVKHFYDSLTLAKAVQIDQIDSMIDVGTGAGFPGIPLKIAFPHVKVVLLDSLQKRVGFLQKVVTQLDLDGVECVHGRAEELAHQKGYRQSFALATARAVAKLNVLVEYGLPFVKVGGVFVAMKGATIADEIKEATKALHILGKASVETVPFALPEEMGTRYVVIMHKRDHSPHTYPRKAGTPKKQPLL